MASKSPDSPKTDDLESIFSRLDVDGDGRISVSELSRALKRRGVQNSEDQAHAVIVDKSARRKRKERQTEAGEEGSGMTFSEFVKFVSDQETQLKLAFRHLDKDKNNELDAEEIQAGMKELGVNVSLEEAEQLLKKMDRDNSLTIDFNEWRDFLLFSDATNLGDIVQYWRKATSCIDLSGDPGGSLPGDFTEEEVKSGAAWKTLVAGGVAGAVSRSCTAPLDRLKVTWQVLGGRASQQGVTGAWKAMLKEGGVTSLWRGNGINCIKIAPEMGLKFYTYDKYKGFIKAGNDVTMIEKLVAGGLAGATSQTIIYPVEVLKTRMCLRKSGQYSSVFHCARQVYAEGGVAIFFRGYLPNLLGILPYAGIDLALYETFRGLYEDRCRAKLKAAGDERSIVPPPPIGVSLCAGAVASICAQLGTYPLALVRTKLQAGVDKNQGNKGSMMAVFKTTLAQEGPTGFYRGIGPNMLKVIPSVSVSYAILEEMRRLLGVTNKN